MRCACYSPLGDSVEDPRPCAPLDGGARRYTVAAGGEVVRHRPCNCCGSYGAYLARRRVRTMWRDCDTPQSLCGSGSEEYGALKLRLGCTIACDLRCAIAVRQVCGCGCARNLGARLRHHVVAVAAVTIAARCQWSSCGCASSWTRGTVRGCGTPVV